MDALLDRNHRETSMLMMLNNSTWRAFATRADRRASGSQMVVEQKIAVVCMVRDEIDVIDTFVQHHLALVDRVVIVDHLSRDGTFEALERFSRREPRLDLLTYDGVEYFQSAIVSELTRRAARLGATWILPLDADEFLAVTSRRELLDLLSNDPAPVKHFEWQNLVPLGLARGDEGTDDDWNQGVFLGSRTLSPHVKIAVSGSYVRRNPQLVIGHGSHRVMQYPGAKPQRGVLAGKLLHIPVRSSSQAKKKFTNGSESLKQTEGREPSFGSHWLQLDESLKAGATRGDLVSSGLSYGEDLPEEEIETFVFEFAPLGERIPVGEGGFGTQECSTRDVSLSEVGFLNIKFAFAFVVMFLPFGGGGFQEHQCFGSVEGWLSGYGRRASAESCIACGDCYCPAETLG